MQGARLDRHLNLVMPVYDTSLGTVWVFHTPVSRQVFERYYRVMARAWTLVASMGGTSSGPKIAALELKTTANDMAIWDGPTGVEKGLFEEIRRLTNVVCPAENGGWEPVPLMDAVAAGTLDADDLADVEGIVTFFTLASAIQPRRTLTITASSLAVFFSAQTTSFGCSEWIASEMNSNETEISSQPQPRASENAVPTTTQPADGTSQGQAPKVLSPAF